MTEADLRIMSDSGGMTVVSITELVREGQLSDRAIDAIEAEFEQDDDIVVER